MTKHVRLGCKLNGPFISWNAFLLRRVPYSYCFSVLIIWQILSWKWKEWNCYSRKKNDNICCQLQNSSFGKHVSATMSLIASQYLDLSDENDSVLQMCFLALYNEIFQYWKDLHNLISQYFPNNQCMKF